jgi:hypothetical protein
MVDIGGFGSPHAVFLSLSSPGGVHGPGGLDWLDETWQLPAVLTAPTQFSALTKPTGGGVHEPGGLDET